MAGDWIKFEVATSDKPEVYAIAADLGVTPEQALGHCLRLWVWADQNTPDGCNARSVTLSALNAIARVTGIAEAMVKVGWLRVHEWGIEFVNGDRHNGQTAKSRALTQRRVREHRRNASVTRKPLPEKRREESNTPCSPPKGGRPPKAVRVPRKTARERLVEQAFKTIDEVCHGPK